MQDRSNTIAGWVLGAGIVALGTTIVTGEIYKTERPEHMGYAIQGVEEDTSGGGAAAEQPIETYLASADPAKGSDVFKKCAACHNADKGGANAIGPNLYGVVGDAMAAGRGGFAFSDALVAAAKAHGGSWNWANLGDWLKSPKAFAPGTKMTFAGLSNPQDRANVIAWLNTQSDHPLPLPKAPPAGAASDAKAAAEGKDQPDVKAKNQPVQSEAQAAKQPAGNIAGEGAPSVDGRSVQQPH